MSRSLRQDLLNPNLFKENKKGDYTYSDNGSDSKAACGSLHLTNDYYRNSKAQIEAGGEARRQRGHEWGADDGGHLIGTRFGGSPYEENLTAQNSNLNRQDFKRMENKWASHLAKGDGYNVFVNVETFGEDRPNAYTGYAIYEYPDGSRTFETFSYSNESRKEQGRWNDDLDDYEEENGTDHLDDYAEDISDEGANYNGEYAEDYGEDSEISEEISSARDDDICNDSEEDLSDEESYEQKEQADDLTETEEKGDLSEETDEQEEQADDLTETEEKGDLSEETDEQEEQADDLTETGGEVKSTDESTEGESSSEDESYSY